MLFDNGAQFHKIELPPKIWRPRVSNKHISAKFATDIDDGIFDYSRYGRIICRPNERWVDRNVPT